jgi:hypothetical protein
MGNKRKTFDTYRDSNTGLFITEDEAKNKPRSTWVKERVPKPNQGIGK